MKKYLHITEYSSNLKYKIPNRKHGEFDLELKDSIIRSKLDEFACPIRESFDTLFDQAKLEEQTIPIDDVYIYDDLDIEDDDQKIAYVFRCPICGRLTIQTNPNLDSCLQCEEQIFKPEVIGLINRDQMEDISINNSDVSTYIQIKNGKIKVYPKEDDKLKKVNN